MCDVDRRLWDFYLHSREWAFADRQPEEWHTKAKHEACENTKARLKQEYRKGYTAGWQGFSNCIKELKENRYAAQKPEGD